MRILQVNKYHYLRGGAEKYFIEISKELEKAGHQVAIFSMRHPKNLPSPWEKYFVSRISFNEGTWRDFLISPFRIIYSLEARRKFKRLIKDFKPDIIHFHNIYHQISPSILPVAKKYKIPVVMHLHDYKLFCPNYQLFTKGEICYRCRGGKYYQCLQNKCFKNSWKKSFLAMVEMSIHHKILKIYKKNVDYFIAPSKFMKETALSFSWPEEKLGVVYNFPENLKNKNPEFFDDYGLYFGRLSPEKGIDLILEALSFTKSNIKFKIIGSGPEKENLIKKTKDLGLEKQVEFLGPKFFEDLYSLVRKAKFVVLPSIWAENMPLVLLEAMVLKKVLLVAETGGLPELIKNQESGFIFQRASAKDLARVIDDLDNYDLKKIGARAGEIAENLKIDKHLGEILKIYKNLF